MPLNFSESYLFPKYSSYLVCIIKVLLVISFVNSSGNGNPYSDGNFLIFNCLKHLYAKTCDINLKIKSNK